MRGIAKPQGRLFSAAGWRAVRDGMPTAAYDADAYGQMGRMGRRPLAAAYHEAAVAAYQTGIVPAFPAYHIVEPTSVCNRACPFCPIHALNDSRAAKKRLDWTDYLAYLRGCVGQRVYGLSLYQLGEPLLWRGHDADGRDLDLRDMVTAAKRIAGFQIVHVSTNGDVPNLDLLLDCPIDDVIISIDGTTAQVYGENRPSPAAHDDHAFSRTKDRVKAFLSQKVRQAKTSPHVTLQIIEKANTREQIAPFLREWISVPGVDDVFVKRLDGMAPWVGDAARTTAENASALAAVATQPCQHLWAIGSMTAEGIVNACCHDARTELTDGSHIGSVSPSVFWRGPFMEQLREEHRAGIFRAPCATCAERTVWLGDEVKPQ